MLANLANIEQLPPPPTVSVQQVDSLGLVSLSFSNPMTVVDGLISGPLAGSVEIDEARRLQDEQ